MNTQLEGNEQRTSRIPDFFRNPLVGITGSIASVLGILLSVYFYWSGQERPKLTYYVHPSKAAVFRTGQASRLRLMLDEQIVKNDISAAQVAFWNAGRKAIRQADILRNLTIRTSNGVPIIEARIRKISRDVVRVSLDESKLTEGQLTVMWNILENSDGAVVQLIYQGDESTNIVAAAVVAGQPEISRLGYFREIRSSSREYERLQSESRLLGPLLFAMIIALLMTLPLMLPVVRRLRSYPRLEKKTRIVTFFPDWLLVSLQILVIIVGGIMYLFMTPPSPPFGF